MRKLMEAIQKNETSRKILATDEGIVEPISVKAWKDTHGKIHLSEHFARLGSATHSKCQKCGNLYPLSSFTTCPDCREKSAIERYNGLGYREWDGETPLYSDLLNRYFMDADELTDYCFDESIDVTTLRLKLCEPNKYSEINEDYWEDSLAEDQEDLPKALVEALNKFNEVIRSLPTASWSESRYRTNGYLIS